MAEKIMVKYIDGRKADIKKGVSVREALNLFIDINKNGIIAAKSDDSLVDLDSAIDNSLMLEPITLDSKEGLDIYRHSIAHVMAQAVKGLFAGTKLAIGPAIKDGFYYDFDPPRPFKSDDLKIIEERMQDIINRDIPIKRELMRKDEAIRTFKALGETYKEELINEIKDDDVSIYRQGDFFDLCKGPHLPSTGLIKAFKLTGTAGAYWRGEEKNKMLFRIYGTAFLTDKELEKHLLMLEEARHREHRRLAKELDLYSTDDMIGAGLILWHPRGAVIRGLIEDFWKKEHIRAGYNIVYTPHIAKAGLWERSGHMEFYRENMYSPMDVEGQDYMVKPMNCPFHIEIYKSQVRSYRDLPIKYAELGTVYRYERSGVLHGLLRVRGFTQDDAHIFLRPDQLKGEIEEILKFTLYILRSFGFNEFEIFLSTRPQKFVGSIGNWEQAEGALKKSLEDLKLEYCVDPGEGVFYGPKIDIKIKDVLGRAWQCSTIQVDFNLPERFRISYRESDGSLKQPIMVHRALMGSLERFFGCLIEHYGGAFPLWLAPVQVAILTITDRSKDYAKGVNDRLNGINVRTVLDIRNEKLGLKIREAELMKIPYIAVIGDREVKDNTLSIRSRLEKGMSSRTIDEFIAYIQRENKP